MIKALSMWLKAAWWHWPLGYVAVFAVYVVLAILIWGFIYRPNIKIGNSFPFEFGEPWDASDVTTYAFMQAAFWPLVLVFYVVFFAIGIPFKILKWLAHGCSVLATKATKIIPDNRPSGFQLDNLKFAKSELAESNTQLPRIR